MIKPTCISCNEELTDFGAILLSPPRDIDRETVMKHQLCKECYMYHIMKIVDSRKKK